MARAASSCNLREVTAFLLACLRWLNFSKREATVTAAMNYLWGSCLHLQSLQKSPIQCSSTHCMLKKIRGYACTCCSTVISSLMELPGYRFPCVLPSNAYKHWNGLKQHQVALGLALKPLSMKRRVHCISFLSSRRAPDVPLTSVLRGAMCF